MHWILIVVLSVSFCIVYGVVHDQITARICAEYFTVGHAPIVGTDDPTLLGLAWGVLGTWWVGMLLGIPLATSARIGSRPKRDTSSLIGPMFVLSISTAIVAAVAAMVGFVAASSGWISPVPDIATRLPLERHIPFLVALWRHNGSYTSGFVGGIVLMAWIWWTRIKMATADKFPLRNRTSQCD